MIHRLSWVAIGRSLCAALRAIAGPTLPLPAPAEPAQAADAQQMASEVEAFVLALHADLIDAEDFAD